jgi:hypothetical protein
MLQCKNNSAGISASSTYAMIEAYLQLEEIPPLLF